MTERQEDIIATFVEAVDRIISLRPDVCIHAGDLFDSVRPLNRIMAVAGEQLHRLAEEHGIPTVIIAGNHDAPKQPHVGAALDVYRQIDNLHIACSGRLERFEVGEASIFALPHCLTGQMLQEELQKCIPDDSARFNIMVGHGVAAGMPEFAMADLGEQEIAVAGLRGFDYVALGHFHNQCRVAENAWYCGSTERLSQAERDAEKGFLEVGLGPLEVAFHPVAARQMVDLEVIDAAGKRGDELAEVIRQQVEAADGSDKIVRLKVEGVTEETLKTMPTEVITELKQKSFALDVSFRKAASEDSDEGFGRAALGRLDQEWVKYLEAADLEGFDSDRIRRQGLTYLSDEQ